MISAVMEALMNEICSALSRKDIYFEGPQAPSFFVIYAHDNPNYGRADDRIVKKFIGYLRIIGSKAQSDRNPVIRQSPDSDSTPYHDILANQFCLLPEELTTNSVEKVLLCFSEVFHAYCSDPKGREYIKRVVKAGHDEAKRLEGRDDCMAKVQRAIRQAVNDGIEKEEGFHHVLTEIALLQLRVLLAKAKGRENDDTSTVVLVDLHSTNKIFEGLPFLSPTKHWLTLPPVNRSEASHRLFFRILERVYEPGLPLTRVLESQYNDQIQALRSKSWSSYEFRSKVLDDINRALTTEKLYTHTRYNQVESAAHANDRRAPQSGETYTPLESKCFEKLRFTGMENRQEDVIESIDLAGTCEWILAAPEFTRWRSRHEGDQTNCQLWIKGHPGTGKSVATRKVLEIVKQKRRRLEQPPQYYRISSTVEVVSHLTRA
ncbi:hypothetical protein PG997_010619 [Apiospora hydei]|uniref:Nephrocystin 3-like N-terminal domain-containing protein n=1 Tax=Apiospora hydei TaxID=1337664 RepID=A0ABR1VJF0_9PEZI